jgi:hypothetical protein
METDAFMVMVLGLIHYNQLSVGIWILIPSSARYVYELYSQWISSNDIPPKRVRSTIAVMFYLALLTPFVLDKWLFIPLLQLASVGILGSFLASMIYGISKR